MADVSKISAEEIQTLPRWARMAFAARSVRRARNLLQGNSDAVHVIERAIKLVEEASAKGQGNEQLADAAAAAYTLALNAVEHADQATQGDSSGNMDDALIVTCTVAHAAAFAAEAATMAVAKMAAFLVTQSVDFAVQAHIVACPDQIADLLSILREDFDLLQGAVAEKGWGNLTPVAVGCLGPL